MSGYQATSQHPKNSQLANYNYLNKLCSEHNIILLGVINSKSLDQELAYHRFTKWIDQKKHGQMFFLENHREIRKHPRLIAPQSNQIIVCGYSYGDKTLNQSSANFTNQYHPNHQKHNLPSSENPKVGYIAQYARVADYHRTLKKLAQSMFNRYLKNTNQLSKTFRVLVDSAPIMEKNLACETKSGFQGKNTLFIIPNLGSLVFLFEIFTNAKINHRNLDNLSDRYKPNNPKTKNLPSETIKCHHCKRCQVHCPTNALDQDYQLDANKCISYYTIEHRGLIPIKYWSYLDQFFFGCDICQLVCPYNRYAKKASILKDKITKDIPLTEVVLMNQATYEYFFASTPITRAKIIGLRRNALISLYVKNYVKFDEIKRYILKENIDLLVQTIGQIPKYHQYLRSQKTK